MNQTKNTPFIKENQNPTSVSNEEWEKILPRELYHIARERGTERP